MFQFPASPTNRPFTVQELVDDLLKRFDRDSIVTITLREPDGKEITYEEFFVEEAVLVPDRITGSNRIADLVCLLPPRPYLPVKKYTAADLK